MALDDPPPVSGEAAHEARPVGARPLPASRVPVGDEYLPCGRSLSRAWELVRDSEVPDPHATHCPHCQQAVEGLAALDPAAHALRAGDLPDSRNLADRVMRAVRAEIRLGRLLPLDDPAEDLWIAERAAARALRRAADGVPGVRAAGCRLRPAGDGTAVHVSMTLASTLDQPLPDRAAEVRRAVLHAAEHELGLAVTGVDLRIDALLDPPGTLGDRQPERRDQR
ncbi:hypothetical protein ACIHFC_16395 [Streptomyces sp. NPDC052013]|uniref:hypothetical protein n=1 Tax=Streptomyces sp. NPDC052013 TaxID=3365679 RepID=UPI0037D666E6